RRGAPLRRGREDDQLVRDRTADRRAQTRAAQAAAVRLRLDRVGLFQRLDRETDRAVGARRTTDGDRQAHGRPPRAAEAAPEAPPEQIPAHGGDTAGHTRRAEPQARLRTRSGLADVDVPKLAIPSGGCEPPTE